MRAPSLAALTAKGPGWTSALSSWTGDPCGPGKQFWGGWHSVDCRGEGVSAADTLPPPGAANRVTNLHFTESHVDESPLEDVVAAFCPVRGGGRVAAA